MRAKLRAALVGTSLLAVLALILPAVAGASSLQAQPAVHLTGRTVTLGPARLVDVRQIPGAPAPETRGQKPTTIRPFLTRNPSAFAQGKRQAVATGAARSAPRLTSLARAKTGGASLPLFSYETQASKLCSAFAIMLGVCDELVTPPDTQVAAGSNVLVEMINASLSFWSKSGRFQKAIDLNQGTFFPVPSGWVFSDPRVMFDAQSGRWFASGVAFDPSTYNSETVLAVSTTSDPTKTWYTYTVAPSNATGCANGTLGTLHDQPRLGVSDDKVVLAWDDYLAEGLDTILGCIVTQFQYTGAETWVIDKGQLMSAQIRQPCCVAFGPDLNRFAIIPAQSLSSTTTEYLVYNNSEPTYVVENYPSGTTGSAGNVPTIGVVAITGNPTTGDTTWTEYDLPMSATSLPPDAPEPGGGLLATDDDRYLNAVWQNGILWTGGNDACPSTGAACLRLEQVDTNALTVRQDFDVTLVGGALFYPAVGLDPASNAFFAFSASSPTGYPEAAYGIQRAGDVNIFTTAGNIRQGVGVYSCGGCSTSDTGNVDERWGDYSSVARDPASPSHMWVSGEYAASSSDPADWGTATLQVSSGS